MLKATRRRSLAVAAALGAAMALLAPPGAVAHLPGTTTIGGFSTQAATATAIAAGYDHTCALTSAGGVMCWGRNDSGQLGDGTTSDRYSPVAVSGLTSGVAAIGAGVEHTCALTRAGLVMCWGLNYYGQLGDGTTIDRSTPVRVIGFEAAPVECVVPNVLGKPLAKAKAKITRAHCRVGTVKRVASPKRKNTVVAESPRPGKRLRKGAKVKLKVSRGR